jgi:hypothetical protein
MPSFVTEECLLEEDNDIPEILNIEKSIKILETCKN